MKRKLHYKVLGEVICTIIIFGMCLIIWNKFSDTSLSEAVVVSFVSTVIVNFFIPTDINLFVIIKDLWQIFWNKDPNMDFEPIEKRSKRAIGFWASGLLMLIIFLFGYNLQKKNIVFDTAVAKVSETTVSDINSKNIGSKQNDALPDTKNAADSEETIIPEKPAESQYVPQYDQNDIAADNKKIIETKDDESPSSPENEIIKNTQISEDMESSIIDKIERIISDILPEKTERAELPNLTDNNNKENLGDVDFPGEHGADNAANNKIEDSENSKPTGTDEAPDDSGLIADEIPDNSGLIADVSPEVSRPAADAAPGVSGPIADASPEISGPIADMSPGISGPIADASPGISGPIADASPGVSGPIADASPEVKDPGPTVDASPGISGPIADTSPGDSIETKPEDTQPSEPDDNEDLPIQRNDYIVSPIEKREGETARQSEKEKTVMEEEADDITIISGETKIIDKIYYAGQERRYYFRPETTGTYYLKIISAKDCSMYSVNFCRENDEKKDDYSYTFEDVVSEEILPVNMNADEDYLICIKQPWGFGNYELHIKYPNKAEDISDYNSFQNYLCYPKEEHVYLMTPKQTGCYRFDISGVAENKDIRISICSEAEGAEEYVGNKDGLTIEHMQGDVTYKIIVSQEKGFSPYDLQIGWQKETVSLNGFTGAQDSIQYQDQLNKYEFTAEESGTCYFQVLDLKEDLTVDIVMFDEEGKETDSCRCTSEGTNGLDKHVEKGEHFTIGVRGLKGTGVYILDYKICPDNELKMD